MAAACCAVPKVIEESCREKSTSKSAPRMPRSREIRRRMNVILAMCSILLEPAASAICRTPLLLTPMPAKVCVSVTIEP